MIVKTDLRWIGTRLFWFGIAGSGIMNGQILLGITLVILTFQRSAHEFIHAAIVYLTKGEVTHIMLGPGHTQYIRFHVTDRESAAMVYFAGFLFDSLCIGFCTAMLMLNKDLIYMILGYALFLVMMFFHIIPEESDFNIWKRIVYTA
jgi:hypothetical protein